MGSLKNFYQRMTNFHSFLNGIFLSTEEPIILEDDVNHVLWNRTHEEDSAFCCVTFQFFDNILCTFDYSQLYSVSTTDM